ncbi:MAG: hypothetical protein KDB65_02015 [Calditrichaeota bacterium]|nr:hypothetical protein [Calditrichota bacterium]
MKSQNWISQFVAMMCLVVASSWQAAHAQINPSFFVEAVCIEDTNTTPNGAIDEPGDVLQLTARAAFLSNFCDSVDVGLDPYPDLGLLQPSLYPTIVINCPSGPTGEMYRMNTTVTVNSGFSGFTLDSCLVTATLTFHPAGVLAAAGTPLNFGITWFGFSNSPPPGFQSGVCADAGYAIASPCSIRNKYSNLEIEFRVNMNVQELAGNFSPETDSVVIRGNHANLGNWGGALYMPVEAGNPGIYSRHVLFDSLDVDHVLEYKFVVLVDGDENSANWESTPNRVYTVTGLEVDSLPEPWQDGYGDVFLPVEYFSDVTPDQVLGRDLDVVFSVDARPLYNRLADEGVIANGIDTLLSVSDIQVAGYFNSWQYGNFAPEDFLNDDGINGDVAAGDSVFSGTIHFNIGEPNELIYKYAANGLDLEADFGEDHVQLLDTAGGVFHLPLDCWGSQGTWYDAWPCTPIGSVGTLYQAGTSYYDQQHNSTAGRMIAVDTSGYVHVAWMNGIDQSFAQRDVYYNVWDPNTSDWSVFFPNGVATNSYGRAGYTSLAVTPNGFAFPSFHGVSFLSGNPVLPCAAIDFQQRAGAFTQFFVDPFYDSTVVRTGIWPKVAIGLSGNLHVVTTENLAYPQPFYYSRGVPVYDSGFGIQIDWQDVDSINGQPAQQKVMDSVSAVSPNIAASRVSNRVAMVWSHSRSVMDGDEIYQDNNDLYLSISEDDGLNWGEPINVTNFCGPDRVCPNGDWQTCNGDTLRVWADNSVMIDDDDVIHVAFTVGSLHYWTSDGQPAPSSGFPYAAIWYWNSASSEFSPVATQFSETPVGGVGGWHRTVCKPSLAYDDVTGNLYCSYWKAMPDQWSASGYAMGDIFVSKSTDSGMSWSVGKNVTDTDGGQGTPAPGSMSERDATVAERITARGGVRYLHMFYELDHDAGSSVLSEGGVTLNEFYYDAIPVDSIPASPTVPWQSLHVTPATGACCYDDEFNQTICAQMTVCDCQALGGHFQGIGTTECSPENDHCPGTIIECLPFTQSGNNCCATLDWNDCGISAKDVFYTFSPAYTTTARLSLCDSPESWDTYISIYSAGTNGYCTDGTWAGCLDTGCDDPLHVNEVFTFTGGQTYHIVLSGFDPGDCGSFVFNMTNETDFDTHYPEPDTLQYDDGQPVFYELAVNLWFQARMTAPSDFLLSSAYLYSIDGNNVCPEACSLYVYTGLPDSGAEVSTGNMVVNEDFGWVDVSLSNTVLIPAGSDFYLQFGPVSGGPQNDGHWNPVLDGELSESRSKKSGEGQFGNYVDVPGDVLLRVGGELSLGVPDSLVIHPMDNGTDVELRWSPAYGATEYNVYRSESPDIQPLPENFLGTILATNFVDYGVLTNPEAQYYYIVTAAEVVPWAADLETGGGANVLAKASETTTRVKQTLSVSSKLTTGPVTVPMEAQKAKTRKVNKGAATPMLKAAQ